MKERLIERMYNLIAQRAQTANDAERAELTRQIRKIQSILDGM